VVARPLTYGAKPKVNEIGLHLPHNYRTSGKLPGLMTHTRELNRDETKDGNGSGSGWVEQLPARQQRGCG
jgi:hypothetical protein